MSCILTAIPKLLQYVGCWMLDGMRMLCLYAFSKIRNVLKCKRFANCCIFEYQTKKKMKRQCIYQMHWVLSAQDSTDCGTCVQFCATNEET